MNGYLNELKLVLLLKNKKNRVGQTYYYFYTRWTERESNLRVRDSEGQGQGMRARAVIFELKNNDSYYDVSFVRIAQRTWSKISLIKKYITNKIIIIKINIQFIIFLNYYK